MTPTVHHPQGVSMIRVFAWLAVIGFVLGLAAANSYLDEAASFDRNTGQRPLPRSDP